MSVRIKHELARILVGVGMGSNFSMMIMSLWEKNYSWSAVHLAATAILFVIAIQIERFELHSNLLLQVAEAKRQFAELMLQKLVNGSMDIEITNVIDKDSNSTNWNRENSNASQD